MYDFVITLSGGKASWAAGKLARQQHPDASMVGLFTDTNGEDPDLYRFLREAATDLDVPLVWLNNGGQTIWDVFRKKRMIGNPRVSNCSYLLKQKPAREWLDIICDPATTTVVVGIDWTEIHRLPAIERNYQPFKVLAPLTEPSSWSRDEIDEQLAKAGITAPALYDLGFPHNNCAGACVRAGQGQWLRLLVTNPERYAEEERQEQEFRDFIEKDVSILKDRRGGTTKPLTLRALRERGGDASDIGGCGCMSLPVPEEEDII